MKLLSRSASLGAMFLKEALKSIRNRLTTTEIDLASKVEKKEFDKIAS